MLLKATVSHSVVLDADIVVPVVVSVVFDMFLTKLYS